jgi:hypothetical protein
VSFLFVPIVICFVCYISFQVAYCLVSRRLEA